AARKGQPLLLIHRNLGDAVQLILDRIFNGDDFVFFVSNFVERCVQRRRFTRSGRTRHEHHAVWFSDVATKLSQVVRIEPDDIEVEILERLVDLFFVEDTNHRVFAVHGRHDRNAKVDVAGFVAYAEATVLRHATLGDVEFRHYLDT